MDILCKTIVKSSTTAENRLVIVIRVPWKAYGRRDISNVVWIGSKFNVADGLTKKFRCKSLEKMPMTGKMGFQCEQWTTNISGSNDENSEDRASCQKGITNENHQHKQCSRSALYNDKVLSDCKANYILNDMQDATFME